MKDPSVIEKEYRRLSTPRAAAIAGILFGVLFSISLVLLRGAIPENITTDPTWVTSGAARINLALGLMPFAAIAYLWFIGVVRDKLGEYEDKFFSTVFFGSSLLFLAMVFTSMGIAGGILATYPIIDISSQDSMVIYFGRAVMQSISNVYALRMAGVTMISLATIWIRTGLMPRWLAVLTYLLALALLLVTNFGLWVTLIFPGWVVLVSLLILRIRFKQKQGYVLAPE
jgi:hypothetical protein